MMLAPFLLFLAVPQEAGSPAIVVTAPLKATPQTPATMVVEPVAMMIAACDADGDAVVDRSEMIACVRHAFESVDTARQGPLRYIAFADWAERWLGDRNALPSPFEVDRNSDDRVTLDELQQQFSRLFARYDSNGDKRVTRTELLTFRTAPVGANGPAARPADKPKPRAGGADRRRPAPPGGSRPQGDEQP